VDENNQQLQRLLDFSLHPFRLRIGILDRCQGLVPCIAIHRRHGFRPKLELLARVL